MKRGLHCWDLNLGITEIDKDLSKEIKEKLLKRFNRINKAAKYYAPLLNKSESHLRGILSWICKGKTKQYKYIHKSQECAIPIVYLIKIAKTLNITKERIEENLISIRNFNSAIKIRNPNFPINISPITSSLLFHYYCDGSRSNWCQSIEKHPKNRKRYFQKIEKSIGKLINWNSKRYEGVYTPIIIYQILEKLFSINRKDLTEIKFPMGFLKLDKEVLLGALITIISDEGHICKNHYEIRISQKDENAIKVFHKICEKLQYEVSSVIKKKRRKIYSFKIRWNGLLKLHKDILNINKKYNILDLGDKQKIFEEKIRIMKQRVKKENLQQPKGHGTKLFKKDIEILKYFKTPITKREISKITREPINTLQHRKGRLKNFGLIEVIGWKNKETLLKITSVGEKYLKAKEKTSNLYKQTYIS